MPAAALVDTGAVVALFNVLDPHHAAARAWFGTFRGRFLSTEAVVTEIAYVLGSSRGYQRAALIWLQRMREAKLLQVEAPPDYASIVTIMERYADLPCDFADATLIDLSERTGVLAIATVDQRDFSVYRSLRGKRFKIVLTS